MSVLLKSILITSIFYAFSLNGQSQGEYYQYSALPDLPANSGLSVQPGLAGPYAGIDDDVLILAGGANFPGKLPWEGGKKVYYNEILILQKHTDDTYSWSKMEEQLPLSIAYGGAVSTSKGLFCFGGNTEDDVIAESWLLNFLPESGKMDVSPGPLLPLPLSNFAYSLIGDIVYLAGGISETGLSVKLFFRLDISGDDPTKWKWEELPVWNGKPRAFGVGVAQSNGYSDCFYFFSGRDIQNVMKPEVLYDAHVYDPSLNTWTVISDGKEQEFPVMAGIAFPVGASTIAFASGDNGEMMIKQLELEAKVFELISKSEKSLDVKSDLENTRAAIEDHLNTHPGFGRQLIGFNTLTYEIYTLDTLPRTGQVTTTAVRWGEDILIPSGEIRPGVRTPGVLKISIIKDSKRLGVLDLFIVGIYFSILAWMGYFFYRRQKNTNDYFKGGGRVPWWAAGLSIFGTALSAITFMAIPAKTFATDWSYFMHNLTIFMVAPVIVFIFIPYYRKLNITTAYEYLEVRFNLVVRLVGSLSFILFQIGRMGVVLFLPAIALNVATGIDIFVCIGLMGIVSLIYTMMGGIEAVIWTDVIQVIVLLGGALLSLGLIIFSIDGGMSTIFESATSANKFNIFDLEWSLRQPTLWVMLIGGIFANITTYGTDQTMVQRYLTTKTSAEAGKSAWTNAILAVPATLIFFFAGTALFAFYQSFPGELNPTFESNDAIFPWYIISQLPSGLAGLLIAAIFAAAMSSLSSSMNSAATAYATDIHFRFGWSQGKNQLRIARQATLIIGMVGILFAILMATMDIKSLWDQFQKVLGLIIGSLGGVFLLGILVKTANSTGVLIGLGMSILVQIVIAITQPVHLLLYAATGVISCFVFGYFASLLATRRNPE
jgi:SSS family solute:Na+ symporter